jgi:DNA-directed RNA polymerase II subunit RPB1
MLTNFLNIVLDTITLKGIDNIENVTQVQERRVMFNDKGETNIDKEHITITDGINLNGIRMLKGINHSRTKINDVNIVYLNYGIEAARTVIINELINTFESNGAGVNHAHISLLVDMMTYSGEVISIDRHGMNKVDNDPISKASFEKTMDHFINAALYSETDKMTSVSSRIALGRVIPGGTGAFELLIDTEKLKNSEYIENETGGRTSFIPLAIEPLFSDVISHGFGKNDLFIPV